MVNGWSIYLHPLLLDQLDALTQEVSARRQKDPVNWQHANATKRLFMLRKLIFESVPQDPTRAEYRQGGTLGDGRTHWFRAKFFQQYRLFFRYHAGSKIIVFAWANDEDSKRAYGRAHDAYRVFGRMLDAGCPPKDFAVLLEQASAETALARLTNADDKQS